MTRDDAIYMAALIEGEGHAKLKKSISPKGNPIAQCWIAIAMTDEAIVRWCLETTGFGSICQPKNARDYYKPQWRWTAASRQAHAIAKAIMPFVKGEKRKALQEIVDHYDIGWVKRTYLMPLRGEANPSSKLKADVIPYIRDLRGVVSQRDLARAFGVTQTAISKVQLGKSWL